MSRAREMRPAPAPSLSADERIACVVSSYHGEITGMMLESALATLTGAGVAREQVLVLEAPGAFELPVIAQRFAWRDDVRAVLCFGLVLKGETEHDRHIAAACAQGLMRIALEENKPVLFGVLTCATLEQAQTRARRAGEGGLDKGREVALAALATLGALERAEEDG